MNFISDDLLVVRDTTVFNVIIFIFKHLLYIEKLSLLEPGDFIKKLKDGIWESMIEMSIVDSNLYFLFESG